MDNSSKIDIIIFFFLGFRFRLFLDFNFTRLLLFLLLLLSLSFYLLGNLYFLLLLFYNDWLLYLGRLLLFWLLGLQNDLWVLF
jgi:hypothetical protein